MDDKNKEIVEELRKIYGDKKVDEWIERGVINAVISITQPSEFSKLWKKEKQK
jgi:hypothetical protein